jgi:hypothetical protein
VARGRFSNRSLYRGGGYQRAGHITNFKHSHTPIANPDDIPISQISQDYLQAYGSPFTPSSFFRVPPKIPDPYTAEATATWHYDMVMDCRGNDSGEALIFKFAEGFKFGNWDVQGGLNLAHPEMKEEPTSSGTLINLQAMYSDRFIQHQKIRDQYTKAVLQSDKFRYIGSGIKLHDIGAAETVAGRIMATHCDAMDMYDILHEIYREALDYTQPGPAQYFIRNAVGIYGGLAGLLHCAQSNEHLKAKILGAIQTAHQSTGEGGDEFTPQQGVTMRAYTDAADRPFMNGGFPLPYTTSGAINPVIRNVEWYASVNESFQNFMMGTVHDVSVQDIDNHGAIHTSGDATHYCVLINFTTSGGHPTTIAALIKGDGRPWWETDRDLWTQSQGDKGLMCIAATLMAPDRALSCYTSQWDEIVPGNDSLLTTFRSPVDTAWTSIAQIGAQFPHTVKGFTFFKKLWKAVRQAATFFQKNQAFTSSLLGVLAL